MEVLDESEDWLVVDKPAPLLVYRSKPSQTDSLLDRLEARYLYEIVNGAKLSIVTRLDRETSGVCLLAKHSEAASRLGKAMMAHEFQKTYHALCWGWPEPDEFCSEDPLLRQGEVRETEVYVKQCSHPDGAEASTHFRVLDRFKRSTTHGTRFSLVEAKPRTGRTHQIRVHLSEAGFPIVGDKLYGRSGEATYLQFIEEGWTDALERLLLLPRQALHAVRLEWERGGAVWNAETPAEFQLR